MAWWRRSTFKGSKVWVEVDQLGQFTQTEGRVKIRYSKKEGSRIYRASIDRVQFLADSPAVEMDEGSLLSDESSRHSGHSSRSPRSSPTQPPPAGAVIVYTDGACSGNPGPTGAGACVAMPDGRFGQASRSLGHATNNVGELAAIGLSLDLMEEAGVDRDSAVVIYSDSNYARGVLTLGWKAKANRELIGQLRDRLALWTGLEIHWVPGHEGVDGNERADALARAGAQGIDKTEWG